MSRWLAIACLLAAPAARALPVDRTLDLAVGDPRFLRINFVEGMEVDPPDLCQAEQMPATLEILLTPKRAGEGLFYLYEAGRLEVYRLVVRGPKDPLPPAPAAATERPELAPLFKAARAACPQVQDRFVEGEHFLHAKIPDAACREALLPLLAADAYPSDHLRFVFDVAALQAQLQAMKARLDAAGIRGLDIAYEGATLTLRGHVSAELRHRALKAFFPVVAGRIDVDDRTEDPGGGP